MPKSLNAAISSLVDVGQSKEAAEFGLGLDPYAESDNLVQEEDELFDRDTIEDFTF